MNQTVRLPNAKRQGPKHIGYSACPHDCPSTCALEVELIDERTIGRVRGSHDNDYTAGVICAKVARYAEREHHADRLLHPLRRIGAKGSGQFEPISWDDALDLVAENFLKAEQKHGAESVWPYYYAGTMGLVMRDGINRLRHAKKYSGFHSTICVNPAYAGFAAGTGKIAGVDPREMAKSDLVVIWGTNAVNTQVNVMTHAVRARKERGAKIAAVDIYMNGTMEQADLPVLVKPGTDGALACAVMHCLFRDGKADWDYLEQIHRRAARAGSASARPRSGLGLGDHRHAGRDDRGIRQADRRAQARLLPARLRLLALAQRRRQHACGELHPGGDRRLAAGRRRRVPHQRRHLQARQDADRRARPSRTARCACSISRASARSSPASAKRCKAARRSARSSSRTPIRCRSAPDQTKVKQGFAREDLFVCVHEQFMTETAKMADVVLPATTFLEHDDIYRGGGHQYHHSRPQAGRAAGRMPQQSRGDIGAGQARRRRASGFCNEPARTDRPDAAGVEARHARRAGSQSLARLPAAVRKGALSRRLRLARRQIPLQAGLAERAVPQSLSKRPGGRHAAPAGSLDLDRGGG